MSENYTLERRLEFKYYMEETFKCDDGAGNVR